MVASSKGLGLAREGLPNRQLSSDFPGGVTSKSTRDMDGIAQKASGWKPLARDQEKKPKQNWTKERKKGQMSRGAGGGFREAVLS